MVFQKFLNNGKVSLCGAQVVIAVKRYPDESEVSDIISQLRANHVMVHIAVDSIPSGGTNSATLYEMAFQTNGYSYFATGRDLWNAFDGMTSVFGFPYQFLAQNFVVSGGGIIEIPAFKTPLPSGSTKECLIAITIQNHSKDNFQFKTRSLIIFAALDSSFVSMNYTVASTDGSYSYKFPRNDSKPLYATGQSDVL
ncbi:hypothetical protein CRE_20124 [Caenorhabditis remanei]|uniref:DUF7154 domain-containing protein n=1 Tax=Caenorhabditis remanei TaxID=31234 RepID=E3NPY1_CAERE|nr:hypothetical protein CRE_20124 [Caenorhabditis remanei]